MAQRTAHRGTRLVVGAVGAVLLLVVLTTGASAFRSGTSARPLADVSGLAQVVIFVFAIGAGLAVALAVMMLAAMLGDRDGDPRARRRARRWAVLAGVLAFVVFVLAAAAVMPERKETSRAGQARRATEEQTKRESEATNSVDLWVAGVGFGLGLLAAGAVVVTLRRNLSGVAEEAPAAALPEAVEASLDAVLAEPDPRQAVILAYVTMESTLRAHGIGRAAWETPFEYLERVFAEVGDRSSARRLTELYEVARFADRTVGTEMRDEALWCLFDLRAELSVDEQAGTQ